MINEKESEIYTAWAKGVWQLQCPAAQNFSVVIDDNKILVCDNAGKIFYQCAKSDRNFYEMIVLVKEKLEAQGNGKEKK